MADASRIISITDSLIESLGESKKFQESIALVHVALLDRLPELICRHAEAIASAVPLQDFNRDLSNEDDRAKCNRVAELCCFHKDPSNEDELYIWLRTPCPDDGDFSVMIILPDGLNDQKGAEVDALDLSEPTIRASFSSSLRTTLAMFPFVSLVRIVEKIAQFWSDEFPSPFCSMNGGLHLEHVEILKYIKTIPQAGYQTSTLNVDRSDGAAAENHD